MNVTFVKDWGFGFWVMGYKVAIWLCLVAVLAYMLLMG